jgi:hypothetical protein
MVIELSQFFCGEFYDSRGNRKQRVVIAPFNVFTGMVFGSTLSYDD